VHGPFLGSGAVQQHVGWGLAAREGPCGQLGPHPAVGAGGGGEWGWGADAKGDVDNVQGACVWCGTGCGVGGGGRSGGSCVVACIARGGGLWRVWLAVADFLRLPVNGVFKGAGLQVK
jgi:hypothetical protein